MLLREPFRIAAQGYAIVANVYDTIRNRHAAASIYIDAVGLQIMINVEYLNSRNRNVLATMDMACPARRIHYRYIAHYNVFALGKAKHLPGTHRMGKSGYSSSPRIFSIMRARLAKEYL